ncbi:YdeI/OmpD-associated family protein [Algoriphagus persicinus]|uniref:YdeI/OmpD-associated family protein n=1 Tax=Algoriphagus persicinus TaxID=3108754 RepID=UPI002B380B28|nr:YdeI/OmpD-associated family protein [Algoriphagus sp. E1-3-M2]MEB2783196.1 YdeI/OmpD-associated family protein [Algoriphagus sp. E1-3-M2]
MLLLLVEGEFLLERFQGKGGWTFVKFPKEIMPSSKAFGMMKVSGSVDNFSFEGKHLMPMGNGYIFLPVAKPIRTKIGKDEGDRVLIRLYKEEIPDQIPEELIDCLKDDPGKFDLFVALSKSGQKQWIQYIYSSDNIEDRSNRIIKLLNSLASI